MTERVAERLVWIDCEMTGLNLVTDALIEVAVILTDADLTPLDEGIDIVMATIPTSPKVAAIRKNPKVAITIDQGAFPPKVLLIRGNAEVERVDGIPAGYLHAGHKVMSDEQYPEWEAGVRALYDEMTVITVKPTWVKLLDFETTIPKPVADLIRRKQQASG